MVIITELNRLYGVGGRTPFSKAEEFSFATREKANAFVEGVTSQFKDEEVEISDDGVYLLSHYDGADTTETLLVLTEVR